MSASSFTDWEVRCDFPDCWANAWAAEVSNGIPTAAGARKFLKARDWLVNIEARLVRPEAISDLAATKSRLDYCPDHKDRVLKGKDDGDGTTAGPMGSGQPAGGSAPGPAGT